MKSTAPARHDSRAKNSTTQGTSRRPVANRQHAATARADKKTEDFIAAVMGFKLKLK